MDKSKIVLIMLAILLIFGLIVGVLPMFKEYKEQYDTQALYEELVEEIDEESNKDAKEVSKASSNKGKSSGGISKKSHDKMKAINSEYVGWVSSSGTSINYPVVHTKNSQKYLNMNFYGNRSSSGTLFTFGNINYQKPSQNISIYGHNMGRGKNTMFSSLLKYKSKSYFTQYGTFDFSTEYFSNTYRVFAAFNVLITDSYNFTQIDFLDGNDFKNFINTAKSKSFYHTGVEVYDDAEIITLITCDRSFDKKDGRFVVMAVKQN